MNDAAHLVWGRGCTAVHCKCAIIMFDMLSTAGRERLELRDCNHGANIKSQRTRGGRGYTTRYCQEHVDVCESRALTREHAFLAATRGHPLSECSACLSSLYGGGEGFTMQAAVYPWRHTHPNTEAKAEA